MMSFGDIKAVTMPEFPDEETCLAHMKARGHDETTARKMCQEMRKKSARKVSYVMLVCRNEHYIPSTGVGSD